MDAPTSFRVNAMDKYLTAKEVAALMGVSTRTLWRWIKAGRVRPIRIGKGIRFSRDQVMQEIEAQEYGRPAKRDFALE
jgi:excisionase family DNA binding protein